MTAVESHGRVGAIVVTGATSGIGLATARRIAAGGAAVYVVGRDPTRTAAAVDAVHDGTATSVRGFVADLASQREVRGLASALRQAADTEGRALDAIVHVAGLYSSRRVVTEDGIELTFAVNHLAPFLLTHELLASRRVHASPTRVVVVSSDAHRGATLDPCRVARPTRDRGLRAYARSKLANVLFVRALASQEGATVRAYAVDPGLVDTGIGGKHGGPGSRLVWSLRRRLGTPADVPARTIAALATGALGGDESGTYWRDGYRIDPSRRALDDELARDLWRVSSELCGVPVAAPQAPR